jgi:hypothetical protein
LKWKWRLFKDILGYSLDISHLKWIISHESGSSSNLVMTLFILKQEYFSNVRGNFCKRLLSLFESRVDLFMEIMYAKD